MRPRQHRESGRRQFQRHPAVDAIGRGMDRVEQIGRRGQILQRQSEKQRLAGFARRGLFQDGGIIEIGVLDGFVENGGIGGQAGNGKFVDIALQAATSQQAAGNVVEPQALTELVQLSCGIHDSPCCAPASWLLSIQWQTPMHRIKDSEPVA